VVVCVFVGVFVCVCVCVCVCGCCVEGVHVSWWQTEVKHCTMYLVLSTMAGLEANTWK